jgi:transcriptional regulator with XRE-family HTH domain
MSLLIDSDWLRREMARRGWAQMDLAKEAGISQPTVSAALAGRPIREKNARAMRDAFERIAPTFDGLVEQVS